jgi:hypothetical protein
MLIKVSGYRILCAVKFPGFQEKRVEKVIKLIMLIKGKQRQKEESEGN